MNRRKFLGTSIAFGILGTSLLTQNACGNDIQPVYCGWAGPIIETTRQISRPYISQQTTSQFVGSGKGRIVLLHKYLERALGGKVNPHDQEGLDCVGQAYGLGCDTLAATQIYGLGLPEKFEGKASTEAIYAGSRYEIGYKVHGNARLLRGGGSYGSYASEYLRSYGVLVRKRYGDIDLTQYNTRILRDWSSTGIPDHLEPIARQHPVRSHALVKSYAECRDAICNGYPIVLCSNYGFNADCRRHNPGGRDRDGFLNKCGTWYHAMLAFGVDDTDRPGLLVINSWGPNWVGGPTRHGQPDGSFWVDAKNIDGICSQEDTYAISGFVGFPTQTLDYKLF